MEHFEAVDIGEARAKAEGAKRAGNLEEAAIYWASCYNIDNGSVRFAIEYIDALQKMQRFEEVESFFSKKFNNKFTDKGLSLHFARNAFLLRNWKTSVERWNNLLAISPNHYEGHLKLAECHIHLGRPEEALQLLERATPLCANRVDADFLRISALAAFADGRAERSAELWEMHFENTEPRPANQFAYAAALMQCGRLHDAVSILQRIRGRNDERVAALWQVVRREPQQDNKNTEADRILLGSPVTEALKALIGIVPDKLEPRQLLAERLIADGNIEAAVEQLKKIKSVSSWLKAFDSWPANPAIGIRIARELIEEKKLGEAAALLSAMLLMTPDSAELLAADAELTGAKGDWAKAASQWGRALYLQPHDHLALEGRITAFINLGRLDQAVRYKEDARGNLPEITLSLIAARLAKAHGNWLLVGESLKEIRGNISFLNHGQRTEARDLLIDVVLRGKNATEFLPLIIDFDPHDVVPTDTQILTTAFEIGRANMGVAVKHIRNIAVTGSVERRRLTDLIGLLVRSISTEIVCEIAVAAIRSSDIAWLLLEFGKRLADTRFYRHAPSIFEEALIHERRKGRRAHILLTWAKAAYRYGAAEEVIRCCQRILQFLPGHEETLELLLMTHRDLGDWKQGDAVAAQISGNDTLDSAIIRAKYFIKRGKFKEARELAVRFSWTADIRLMVILAEAAQAQLRFEDEAYYRGQIVQTKPHAGAFVAYGRALIAKGDPQSAVRAFEAALAEDPFYYAAYSELVQIAPHVAIQYRTPPAEPGSVAERLRYHVQILIGENDLSAALAFLEKEPMDFIDHQQGVGKLRAFLLRHAGRLHESYELYRIILENDARSARVVRDMALVLCDLERYEEAQRLISEHSLTFTFGTSRPLFASVKREIALGTRDIESLWNTYQEEAVVRTLARLDDEVKYISDLRSDELPEKLLFCASYGVGDEVRWSTVYPDIAINHPGAVITCEPRLVELFSRSFPTLKFVPARRRMREQLSSEVYQDYLNLPDRTLFTVFDEASWKVARAVGSVSMVSDALAAYRNSLDKFGRSESTLQASRSRRIYWRSKIRQLPKGVNIGISWRSSVQGATRNVHYTDLSQWHSIFAIPGVNFINIQYDDPLSEIAAANAEFGINIVDFPEIDLKNDLDDLSALLVELDLVIAPCISTAELAGAMGVHTLLMSNSPVMKWRVRQDGTDVWFKNLRCVFGDAMFDKASLIDATARELRKFVVSVSGDSSI